MYFLNDCVLPGRGARAIAEIIDVDTDETEMVTFAWLDYNQQFLIGKVCCSSEGKQIERKCLRPA